MFRLVLCTSVCIILVLSYF